MSTVVGGATISALSPMLVRRADAAPAAGELQLVAATPNPQGNVEKLFLLKGDPLSGPIRTIVAQDGAPVPEKTLAPGERRVLRLMHFNDMHNHMTDMSKKKGDTHRLAQMVKIVRETRERARKDEIVLFLSAGDDHTGSIFDELIGWNEDEFIADPGYRANAAAGIELATLGNHEFDRGSAQLRLGIRREARFPLLSANVHNSTHLERDRDYFPAAILQAKGLRVGVIGLTTAVDTRTGLDSDPTLQVVSPVRAVTNLYKAVEAASDVVVILSHCGYGAGMHRSGKSGAARKIGEGDFSIAEAIGPMSQKPVVLIGGHSHTELNTDGLDEHNMVSGVLLTQAKAFGQFLGNISMSVAADEGRDKWFNNVDLHPIKLRDDRVREGEAGYDDLEHDGDYDQAFETAVIAPMISALDEKLTEVIGTVDKDAPVSTQQTVRDRYSGEIALANFMNDTLVARSETFAAGKVDFSLFNASGLVHGIEAGPLTYRAWFDVMPYADQVEIARVTGAQIRDMLNSNARRIVRPEERDKVDVAEFIARGFLHFSSGIRYRIALGASPAEARAVDIILNGRPVEEVENDTFTMAFNTYIALGAGGEAWNGKLIAGGLEREVKGYDVRGFDFTHTGLVYRTELIARIRQIGTVGEVTGAKLDGRLTVA